MGEPRVVAWFSCGITSAVAARLSVDQYGDRCVIAYCDTASEHPDNARFLADVERWLGRKIEILSSPDYADIWDVFERTRWLVGPAGARCTTELKKRLRHDFQQPDDIQVFGFDRSEAHRVEKFKANNPEVNLATPLLDAGLSKADCAQMVREAGIELPEMYRRGYRNNNCIGCVKGQAGYWNKIRKDFPEVFERMAKVERDIGAAICKTEAGGKRLPLYLDELDPSFGRYETEPDIACGIWCGAQVEGQGELFK